MADAILRIKTVMDVGDAVSNVGVIQKSLSKLKLPDNLSKNLNKNITEFYKEYEKYQKRVGEGVKTPADNTAVEKSLTRIRNLYGEIGKDLQKVGDLKLDDIIDLDSGKFKSVMDKITAQMERINKVKVNKDALMAPLETIRGMTKSKRISGDGGVIDQIIGHVNDGNINEAKQALSELMSYADKVATRMDSENKLVKGTMGAEKYKALRTELQSIITVFDRADSEAAPLIAELNTLEKELAELESAAKNDVMKDALDFKETEKDVEKVTDSLKRLHAEEFSFNRQAQDIDRQIQSYFGLSQMIRKVGEIAKEAFNTVKELDAAMVETAVVTNFDVGDMWDMLPTYTEQANQLGSTIKDVYEAATLYFQQGLNVNQSMGLANETLKMARIAGLDAADATNMMTAALRGFNMEINQTSAQRINDVYSELAAITAADTKEIGSAMERTASIANSANMDFETTSAFLSQMIETTREAPENLGTAMKTIVARFQEMKQDPTKLVDSEGVAMDVNKIDTALKTIGVDLTNTKGEFRDLDDVFLDISSKWDSLSQGQQRYIATVAAGSRQQSRFIAMMSNYDRTMELVDAANNSAGASQKQFEKTLDSMASKLNMLKNAWNQFTMGLMNNQIIKFAVDGLREGFTIVNKLLDVLSKIPPSPFEGITKSALTLVTTLGMLQIGKKAARGGVMAGVGWWKNEGKFTENFKAGWGISPKQKTDRESKSNQTIYQEQFDKRLTESAKKRYVQTPVVAKAYLEKIDTSKLDPRIKQAIEDELDQPYTEDVKVRVNNIIDQDANGNANLHLTDDMIEVPNQLDQFGTKIGKFTSQISNAGMALQELGNNLGGPFGSALSTAGSLLMTLGAALDTTATSFMANFSAAMADATSKEIDSVATLKLAMSNATAATTAKALGKALWTSLGPLAAIAAAVGIVIGAYKLLDAAIVTDKEKLEGYNDAAAKSSEAFDAAKQETSELNDSISRIQESSSAFDNLVAGTAEFNEQLINTNEQITALLDKYPMLNDPEFLKTDKNGLMQITEAGFKAVKEYQKQIQANASAVNMIQTADLNAEENRQKAEQLRNKWARDYKDKEKNERDAEILEQRAKAEEEISRQNAIRTSLAGAEIENAEKLASIYSGMYEERRQAAQSEIGGLNNDEIRQRYADFHGYSYDKSTKKITDVEGNEVEYEDKIIRDEVIEQTVLLDFEENAASLDKVLQNVDSRFSKGLEGTFENSGHFISDLLSSNIETDTDLLKQVLSESSTDLAEAVGEFTSEEVATILGKSVEDINDNNINEYRNQILTLLTERAQNIADAQFESYSKLGEMMARASFDTIDNVNNSVVIDKIDKLTAQQANTLNTIGETLEANVGTEAMASFINKASKIYLRGSDDAIKEFDGILNGINWDSPTSRLEGYNKAIASSDEQIHKFGKSMRNSTNEANILGESFDEFLGGDFVELSENMDNFVNAAGEIDANGIMEMSKESKTLKSLLDSGEVSATGLAMALQGVNNADFSTLDGTVLKLLSSLNRLTDEAMEAHRIIENFDPGVDYGEGEDFVKENAEKAKEYYNNNEWGNQQLQNYIKIAAGTDRWNKTLRENRGDLQKTTKSLMKYVTTFSEGFQPAWDQMISGKGINGKSLSDNIDDAFKTGDINKKLKDKFEDVKVSWDDEGFMQIDVGKLTTSELETYFEKIYGVSKEYAQLLMQDLANYDGTISKVLAKNDLKKSLRSGEFDDRKVNGNLILTDEEIKNFKSAGGSLKELADAAGTTAKELRGNKFKVLDKEGNRREDYDTMLRQYAEKFYGITENRIKGLYSEESLLTSGKLDLSKLIADTQSKGFDETQSTQAAWAAYQKLGEGESVLFEGQELKAGLIDSFEDFEAKMAELTETSQWVTVGEAIADGIMRRMDEKENPPLTPENDTNEGDDSSGVKQPKKNRSKKIHNVGDELPPAPEIGGSLSEEQSQVDSLTQSYRELASAMITAAQENVVINPEQQAAITSTVEKFGPLINELNLSNEKLKSLGISLAGLDINSLDELTQEDFTNILQELDLTETQLDTLENTDIHIKTDSNVEETQEEIDEISNQDPVKVPVEYELSPWDKLIKDPKGPQGANSEKPSSETKSQESTYTAHAEYDEIKDAQKAVTKLNDSVEAGGEYSLNVSGDVNSLQKAAKAAKSLSKNQGEKNISIKTGKVDTKSIDNFHSKIKKDKPKIQVGANTDKAKDKVSDLVSDINDKSASITITPSYTGDWDKDVNITVHKHYEDDRWGQNNHIFSHSIPTAGSLASGNTTLRRGGRINPRKTQLTLTGEEGYEVAWLPSQGESMILGAHGPQMVDLPKDAVVWNHGQSKQIFKRKPISADSLGTGRGGRQQSNSGNGNGGGGGHSGGGSKSGGNSGGDNRQSKKIGKKHIKILQRAGKINSWWWNMTKKVEATQRKIDSINKGIEKLLDRVGTTLDSISGEANKYIQALRDQIVLNTRMMDKANEKLNTMDTKKTSQRTKDAQRQVKKDRKKLDKAKQTDSKKDDKKAKKQLKKDKKKLRKTQKGENWATISYDATKKITQKGKKTKKKKVTKKDRVNLSNFIFYNEEAQEYQIDDRAIKKKYGKSKKGQAVRDAAEKRLNNYIDKRNTAEDNINNAQDALDEIGQKLYESFFGWETELTRIWNITQKIAEAEGNRERAESFNELLDAQIADDTVKVFDEFGRTNFDYVNKIKGTFAKGVNEQIDAIKLTALSIGARVQDLQKTLSSADEEETLKNISRLVENSENYYDAMTNRAIAQGKLDDELEKRGTADDAVDKAKKKRQKLKDKLEDADTKKEKKKIKKQIKNAKKQVTEAKDARDKVYKKTEEAVQTQQTAIDEANSVMSGYSADEILDDTKTQAYKAYQKELEDEVEAIRLAHDYMNPQTRTDGTVSINFDSDAFEQDKQAGKFTSTTADKIQNYVKKIVDDSNDLRDTYKDLTDKLTELHTTLADLKEAWVGYSEDLMSYLEDEQEAEIDKYKALSDSIKDALDKLLDQVKKNLDERRKQEDNAKTERDISQKQQRLAALRADTSGGHQVEIAQLEKEIAEAQVDYGRTLEDQLLDRLESQADAAAEQRERIIELQQAIHSAVNNAAKVNQWMSNPEAFKEEIRQAFFTAKGWAEMPLPGQQALETQFNQLYMGLLTNQDKQAVLVDAINATTEEVQVVEGSLGAVGLINAANLGNTNLLESELKAIANKIDANVLQTKQNTEDLLQQAMQQAYENALGSSDQYSEEYIARVMAAARPYIESGLKTEEDVYGDINLWTTDKSQYEYNTADLGRKDALNYANQNNLSGDFLYQDQYQRSIENGKIGAGEYADLLKIGNQSTAELNKQLQDSGLSSKQTANAQLRYEKTQDDKVTKKEAKAIGKANGLTGKALDKWLKNQGYKKGGLANFTGPAWLDGTPSKPELVLNSTDTKNFIALRDVLSKTMGNIHNPNESLNNAMYEININVDHINSDYDVDKIAARIKKDIIKDAGYRNVTQVRNLR